MQIKLLQSEWGRIEILPIITRGVINADSMHSPIISAKYTDQGCRRYAWMPDLPALIVMDQREPEGVPIVIIRLSILPIAWLKKL